MGKGNDPIVGVFEAQDPNLASRQLSETNRYGSTGSLLQSR